MGSGAAVMTRNRSGALLAGLVLSSLTATGCVLGDDTDGPILAVDLSWDRAASARFSPGSCESAGVIWMNWTLRDSDGEVRDDSGDDGVPCESGFNFFGLRPGVYELEVEGLVDDDVVTWSERCSDLRLDRFDKLYSCRVNKLGGAAAGDGDEDAGTTAE